MNFSASTFLASYLHQFSAVVQIIHIFGAIWDKFALKLLQKHQNFKNYEGLGPFNGAIWNEFRKSTIFNA